MEISKLVKTSYKDAFRLITCSRLDLQQKNIDQWDDLYPAEAMIREDIDNGNAFGMFEDEKLIGYIVCDETCVSEYSSVLWKRPCEKILMLHRLCVSPSYQNRGYATKLIEYAEQWARENGYGTIRLDVYEKNKTIMYIVENLNYAYCGNVTLRKGIFRCYEKAIKPKK
jgi:GNAT superfamily N-acetyltransferase